MKKEYQSKKIKSRGVKLLPWTIMIALFLFLLFPIKSLIIKDFFTGNIKYIHRVNKNFYMGVVYTHSVEKTETSEWYKENNNKLVLMEQRYKSLGAGLPSNSPYKFEKTDDGYRLYDINKEMDQVVYRTGAVIANHKLIINDVEAYFKSFSAPKEALSFEIQRVPYIKFVLWRCKSV